MNLNKFGNIIYVVFWVDLKIKMIRFGSKSLWKILLMWKICVNNVIPTCKHNVKLPKNAWKKLIYKVYFHCSRNFTKEEDIRLIY